MHTLPQKGPRTEQRLTPRPQEPEALAREIDAVATAECAAAAEAGLSSVRAAAGAVGRPSLGQAALAVVLRYALMRLSSEEHFDAALCAGLGGFAGALTLGTACGVAARQLAASLANAAQPQRRARRRGTRSPAPLTRAFGLSAVQAATLSTAQAALSHAPPGVADTALLLAGVGAGAAAAAVAGPVDRGLVRLKAGARSALRSPAAAAGALLLLDAAAFAALEAACARLGLDPVSAA